eukprot:s2583_g1.t1
MLKQLPPGALEPLAQFLNHMEATGKAPGQWRVVKFAMLAKNASIERPIGLCDVVYKAWLQVRYSLVQAWVKQYEKWAPWDAAKPGVTCLTVSISRIFKSEMAAVADTGLSAGLDTWIDDVSIDAEDSDAQRAAQKIVALYRTIRLLNPSRLDD